MYVLEGEKMTGCTVYSSIDYSESKDLYVSFIRPQS